MTPRNHRSLAIMIVLTVVHCRAAPFTVDRTEVTTQLPSPDLSAADTNISVKHDINPRATNKLKHLIIAQANNGTSYAQNVNTSTATIRTPSRRPRNTSTKTTATSTKLTTPSSFTTNKKGPTHTMKIKKEIKDSINKEKTKTSEVEVNETYSKNEEKNKSSDVPASDTASKNLNNENSEIIINVSDSKNEEKKNSSEVPVKVTDSKSIDKNTTNEVLVNVTNSKHEEKSTANEVPVNVTNTKNEEKHTISENSDNVTNSKSKENFSDISTKFVNNNTVMGNKTANETTDPLLGITVVNKTEVNNDSYSTEPVSTGPTTDISSRKIDGSSLLLSTKEGRRVSTTQKSTKKMEKDNLETTTLGQVTSAKSDDAYMVVKGITSADTKFTATPYWKKYTMINRKRVMTLPGDVSINSTENEDLLQSGTAQSITSLEKALNITSDIPSLVELKNEILALNKNNTSKEKLNDTQEISTATATNLTDNIDTITTQTSTETVAETTRADVVISSKRAGFLDFSSRSISTARPNQIETTGQRGDSRSQVTSTPTNATATTIISQKRTSTASQRQLAEDAINEELMKEKIIIDFVDAQRQQDNNLDETTKTSTTPAPQLVEQPNLSDSSTEDKLSVKPISPRPQSGLYAVNPNYKPLKKIEVQPPKPFVRNPDDNSWRNESLSSLGIVFKANNSSKPFSQVLKNKTETEWNALLEKYSKEDEPAELRERLEKIAEQRKSKKKKINQFGETVYTDYEESTSGENAAKSKDVSSSFKSPLSRLQTVQDTTTPSPEYGSKVPITQFDFEAFKTHVETTTGDGTSKVIDDYEAADDELEYPLANIDLKKFTTPPRTIDTPAPTPPVYTVTTPPPARTFLPDRKPTIQYFPPREKQKVVVNDYDTSFEQKLNAYTYQDTPRKITPVLTRTNPQTVTTTPPTYDFPKNRYEQQHRTNEIRRPDKNIYLTQPAGPLVAVPVEVPGFVVNQDGGYTKATYVIKHLRDFIDEAAKDDESGYPSTEAPVHALTTNDGTRDNRLKAPADYYDYEAQFRKDVINRFVENFNQNSDRFKTDFPILYNTSVVHTSGFGKEASSTAFMKRLYEDARAIQLAGAGQQGARKFDPNCDRTVELSPAYELHYYVPEEEEKQEFDPRTGSTQQYGIRL